MYIVERQCQFESFIHTSSKPIGLPLYIPRPWIDHMLLCKETSILFTRISFINILHHFHHWSVMCLLSVLNVQIQAPYSYHHMDIGMISKSASNCLLYGVILVTSKYLDWLPQTGFASVPSVQVEEMENNEFRIHSLYLSGICISVPWINRCLQIQIQNIYLYTMYTKSKFKDTYVETQHEANCHKDDRYLIPTVNRVIMQK